MSVVVFRFGTKAETLEQLGPLLSSAQIPPLIYFTVAEWRQDAVGWSRRILDRFAGASLAVRSSAHNEDGGTQSMAGAFHSCLHIECDLGPLCQAVERVIASFPGHLQDQVLVQPMVEEIAVSGVITTHVVDDGAPYYVLNYDDDSGRPDRVTGGIGVSKTVLVSRDAQEWMVESVRVRRWLALTRELERLCGGSPLDIEFAETNTELFLLQVRRIAVAATWNPRVAQRVRMAQQQIAAFFTQRSARRSGLLGERTILGEMPDWNPAEIIGTNPRPLASSLYRGLVTDSVWREARASMGYRHPHYETLMVILGGRPFIDVRNSFNSLLPSDLEEDVGHAIVNAWLERLDHQPELHDKVEFEVATTALDFNFRATWEERYSGLLSRAQTERWRDCLQRLTRSCLEGESLADSLSVSLRLTSPPKEDGCLAGITRLFADCRAYGTLPFAVAARHAFIAESQLRSAIARGALSVDRVASFKASLMTVTGRMTRDLGEVVHGRRSREEFLSHYGHLRPGTYDILSLRYDQREDLFENVMAPVEASFRQPFALEPHERRALASLLTECDFAVTPEQWLEYCATAIVGREEIKFRFSRQLSDILELIVEFGRPLGLDRDHLSYLEIGSVLNYLHEPVLSEPQAYFLENARHGAERMETARALRTSYLIRGEQDLYVAPQHRSAPTFITDRRVTGAVVCIDSHAGASPDLKDAIACIDSADPGFDWIFTRGIKGLITQFGGSNSHMAVRSAELALPAAIGCGELTFTRVIAAQRVELNCGERIVRPFDV